MATSKITYLGDLRNQLVHEKSGQNFVTDAPPDNQGRGEAFSPTDLLATSLGACMLTIMGIAAREHGFTIDGATAEITKIMGTNPRRVVEIIVDLNFPVSYTDKEKKLIEAAALSCPVAKSLHPDIKQTLHFNFK